MKVILFLILYFMVEWTECRYVVFNEINADAPDKIETKEFVELRLIADQHETDYSLDGFHIIVISYGQRGDIPYITTVIKLFNQTFNENRLFVVGGKDIKGDLNVPDPAIMFQNQLQTKQNANFIPNGNRGPIGIALIYNKFGFFGLELNNNRKKITLDLHWKKTIKSNLLDLVVIGRRSYSPHCTLFEELYPYFNGKLYMLRDFDEIWKRDLTLNRCSSFRETFVPYNFRLGHPTPGEVNDCSLTHYNFDGRLIDITPELIRVIPNLSPESCRTDVEPIEYQSIITEKVIEDATTTIELAKNDECSEQLRDSECNSINNELIESQNRLEAMGEKIDNEWDSTSQFKNEWMNMIDAKFPKMMPTTLIRKSNEIQKWFVFNTISSKYRCKICSKYFNEFPMDIEKFNKLADKAGMEISPNYNTNLGFISKHHLSPMHINIVNRLKKHGVQTMEKYFIDLQTKKDVQKKEIAATSRMFRTVYTEIKANTPFAQHKVIVELQKTHGIELGQHFGNIQGASQITSSISSQMHQRLLNYIKRENRPISLIVDTSDDYNKYHYLSILFQTLENNRPTVYFYKLIQLTSDESASGLFKALYDSLVDDELVDYFKKNLVAFSSDGANVMKGETGGLLFYIRKLVEPREIYFNYCSAHRLELVLKHAMKTINYFDKFEKTLNGIHSFYYSHSHKRLQFLREMAANMDVKFYELKHLFKVRWVSSYFNTVKTVKNVLNLLISNLNEIIKSPNFDAATKQTARGLLNDLTDKNFVIILHFIQDILSSLKRISLIFQQRGGTMIGKDYLIQKLIKAFDELKETDASIMSAFLSEVECEGALAGKCNVDDYEKSIKVKWQSIDLTLNGGNPNLSILRHSLLTALIIELNALFPSIKAKNFDIFMPKKLPLEESETTNYGNEEIKFIYNYFKWSSIFTFTQLKNDWISLLKEIIKDLSTRCDVYNLQSHIFWSRFLRIKNIWTARTLLLIKTVLVLPVGSSDSERSFSYLNMITKVHTNIGGKALDELIRCRMNGPLEISRFRANEYAYHWIYIENRLAVDSSTYHYDKVDTSPGENPSNIYFARSVLF